MDTKQTEMSLEDYRRLLLAMGYGAEHAADVLDMDTSERYERIRAAGFTHAETVALVEAEDMNTTAYESSTCLPERPGFTVQYTVREGWLVGMAWQPYGIEIQGRRSVGYQFRSTGVAKITRKGELGRMREVTDYSGLYEAHRLWVEAGKPAEWTYRR